MHAFLAASDKARLAEHYHVVRWFDHVQNLSPLDGTESGRVLFAGVWGVLRVLVAFFFFARYRLFGNFFRMFGRRLGEHLGCSISCRTRPRETARRPVDK